jgi:ferric-dicitrate binding protein FerR (iron transport regulator)
MSCLDVEDRLFDFERGRLDRATELLIHAHLETCTSCRERVELWHQALPELCADEPAPASQIQLRRMEVEIERQLAKGTPTAAPPSRRWVWVAASIAAALVLGVGGLWLLWSPRHATAYATNLVTGAEMNAGKQLHLETGSDLNLKLAAGATLHLTGPARLELLGDPDHVALRLVAGRLEVSVTHRRPDQTFSVILPDGRIEVRGTRFVAIASEAGSSVEVSEGTIAAFDREGTQHSVSAPGSYAFRPAPVIAPPTPVPAPKQRPATRAPQTCTPIDCATVAAKVRGKMRARQFGQAIDLLGAAAGPTECMQRSACGDELGYLRAEALRLAGQTDAAVAAYKALDRPGAPATARQNALYSAGQLERRAGRFAAARADYEAALAAHPMGALREEAMIGAMDAADREGDQPGATSAARRYLSAFPTGLAVDRARAIVSRSKP